MSDFNGTWWKNPDDRKVLEVVAEGGDRFRYSSWLESLPSLLQIFARYVLADMKKCEPTTGSRHPWETLKDMDDTAFLAYIAERGDKTKYYDLDALGKKLFPSIARRLQALENAVNKDNAVDPRERELAEDDAVFDRVMEHGYNRVTDCYGSKSDNAGFNRAIVRELRRQREKAT